MECPLSRERDPAGHTWGWCFAGFPRFWESFLALLCFTWWDVGRAALSLLSFGAGLCFVPGTGGSCFASALVVLLPCKHCLSSGCWLGCVHIKWSWADALPSPVLPHTSLIQVLLVVPLLGTAVLRMLCPQILSPVCARLSRKGMLCLGHVFVVIPSLPLSQLKSNEL